MDLRGIDPIASFQYLVTTDGTHLYNGTGSLMTSLTISQITSSYVTESYVSSSFISASQITATSFSGSLFGTSSFSNTSSYVTASNIVGGITTTIYVVSASGATNYVTMSFVKGILTLRSP